MVKVYQEEKLLMESKESLARSLMSLTVMFNEYLSKNGDMEIPTDIYQSNCEKLEQEKSKYKKLMFNFYYKRDHA